jgi:hypothetical protein
MRGAEPSGDSIRPSIAPTANVAKPQIKMCSVMAGLIQRVYFTGDVIRGKKSTYLRGEDGWAPVHVGGLKRRAQFRGIREDAIVLPER